MNPFLYMLAYVLNLKLENEQVASGENIILNKIVEILINVFAKNLISELKKGIYKEYILKQDNLRTLKGKYLINENLKYNFTNEKIYCEYDEFSEDNKLNQFFLFAVKSLMKFSKDKKLLKKCELILDDITFNNFKIEDIDIQFNRLNHRFQESFQLAMLLLKRLLPTYNKGDKSFAFLFKMNELFEKFIGEIYKNIDSTAKIQYQKNFGNLQLKPDIITQNMIIDTKYKIVKNKDDLNRDDKYQMFVYGINFGIRDTMLLYPKHLFDIKEDLKLGDGENLVNLKMRSIDLSFDGSYDEFIEEIKKRVEEIR